MNTKRIVIAGGSGFLGRNLQTQLESDGRDVIVLTRHPSRKDDLHWDAKSLGPWADAIDGSNVLINMAGRSVDCRYNETNKKAIVDSRIESTRVLHDAVSSCKHPPRVWLNSSTSTIYNDTRGEAPANTEKANNIGDDFSMGVAKRWEDTFFAIDHQSTIQTALRTAIVLGNDGGAFPVMSKIARFGLCSPQGDGDQWISWIHIADFCRAIEFLISDPEAGTINLCSPNPIQNFAFNRILKDTLKPWVVLPQPVWLLKLGAFFMQTETELILKSRKVSPERLLDSGFEFNFPHARNAIQDLQKT